MNPITIIYGAIGTGKTTVSHGIKQQSATGVPEREAHSQRELEDLVVATSKTGVIVVCYNFLPSFRELEAIMTRSNIQNSIFTIQTDRR